MQFQGVGYDEAIAKAEEIIGGQYAKFGVWLQFNKTGSTQTITTIRQDVSTKVYRELIARGCINGGYNKGKTVCLRDLRVP